jgi:hypothetical protein
VASGIPLCVRRPVCLGCRSGCRKWRSNATSNATLGATRTPPRRHFRRHLHPVGARENPQFVGQPLATTAFRVRVGRHLPAAPPRHRHQRAALVDLVPGGTPPAGEGQARGISPG